MSTHNDYSIIQGVCTYCKHSPLHRDNYKQELYCPKCGLIISDNTLSRITVLMETENERIKRIRELWKKKSSAKKRSANLKKN